MNQPKPVTSLRGAYATAHASVVQGRKMKPMHAIQNDGNATAMRLVKIQTRMIASLGESIDADRHRKLVDEFIARDAAEA